MGKGPITPVKRKKKVDGDFITAEAQLSKDKSLFIIRLESGAPMSWHEAHAAAQAYCDKILKEVEDFTSLSSH